MTGKSGSASSLRATPTPRAPAVSEALSAAIREGRVMVANHQVPRFMSGPRMNSSRTGEPWPCFF
jgi:hypothetical protein